MQFGIDDKFAVNIISQGGNCGDVYNRNIGPETIYSVLRPDTMNAAAKDGGLMILPEC